MANESPLADAETTAVRFKEMFLVVGRSPEEASVTSAGPVIGPFPTTATMYDMGSMLWVVQPDTPLEIWDESSTTGDTAPLQNGTTAGFARNGRSSLGTAWARLESAAGAGDERGFVEACKNIDWTLQPPDALMRAVRLAITANVPLVARKMATDGALRYPEHAELQKAARVLAPPRVIRSDLPPEPGLAANVAWLKANTESYGGRWVALKDGILLTDASSFEELTADLGDLRAQRILATKVF